MNWFAGDNCGGAVRVSYDAENGLTFGEGCTTIEMKINSVLPADAVPVTKNLGGKSVEMFLDAPDRACFAGVQSALSNGVLKYDASKCGKDAFKIHGNSVAGQEATLKFYVPGGTYDEFSTCPSGAAAIRSAAQAGFACLKISVVSEDKASLYSSVIDFKQRGSYIDLATIEGGINPADVPVLLIVTNNQQYPSQREIKITHDKGEETITLTSGESKAFAFKGRVPTLLENGGSVSYVGHPDLASTEFEAVKAVAFRRSNKATMVCRTDKTECVGEENLRDNWEYCCKASVEDWREMKEVEYDAGRVACTQCKSFTASQTDYNCDSRCTKILEGEAGYAEVRKDESFYDGKTVSACADENGCSYSCTSWCAPQNCDPECDASGVKYLKGKRVEQTGWKNGLRYSGPGLANPALAVVEFESGEETKQANWPLAEFGGAALKVSTVKNLLADGDYAKLGEADDDVTGCADAPTENGVNYRGLYALSAESSGDSLKIKADVLRLDNIPESYFGYAAEGNDFSKKACSKGKAAKDEVFADMASVPLCAYLWVDQSAAYGTCLNSIYSFEDATQTQGAVTQLSSLKQLALLDDGQGFAWSNVPEFNGKGEKSSAPSQGLCRRLCDNDQHGSGASCLSDFYHNGANGIMGWEGYNWLDDKYWTTSDGQTLVEKNWKTQTEFHGTDCLGGQLDDKECYLCLPQAYRSQANRIYVLKKTVNPQTGGWVFHGLDLDTQPPYAFIAAPIGAIIAGTQKFSRAAGGETTTGFDVWTPLGKVSKYCKIGSQCNDHMRIQEEIKGVTGGGSSKYCLAFHPQTGADFNFCEGATGTLTQLVWYDGQCDAAVASECSAPGSGK